MNNHLEKMLNFFAYQMGYFQNFSKMRFFFFKPIPFLILIILTQNFLWKSFQMNKKTLQFHNEMTEKIEFELERRILSSAPLKL